MSGDIIKAKLTNTVLHLHRIMYPWNRNAQCACVCLNGVIVEGKRILVLFLATSLVLPTLSTVNEFRLQCLYSNKPGFVI